MGGTAVRLWQGRHEWMLRYKCWGCERPGWNCVCCLFPCSPFWCVVVFWNRGRKLVPVSVGLNLSLFLLEDLSNFKKQNNNNKTSLSFCRRGHEFLCLLWSKIQGVLFQLLPSGPLFGTLMAGTVWVHVSSPGCSAWAEQPVWMDAPVLRCVECGWVGSEESEEQGGHCQFVVLSCVSGYPYFFG